MKHPVIREYSFVITYMTYDKDEIFLDPNLRRNENGKSNDAGLDLGIQALLLL
ncbi:MAG: hypothetical protein ACYDHW_16110 [Syntrophorhabdaceae bacterium]